MAHCFRSLIIVPGAVVGAACAEAAIAALRADGQQVFSPNAKK